LERVEAALSSQLRRLGKGLAKADAKISKITDSNIDDVLFGLKKARKKIDSAVD
ncbi:MAG: helix-hairpin-helix domain-containing protein, partial [Deltaproteobacteria bacterium]|nr:helix-hairpin-helix domain-containing protein [Deltaproteobacteria bacterium]